MVVFFTSQEKVASTPSPTPPRLQSSVPIWHLETSQKGRTHSALLSGRKLANLENSDVKTASVEQTVQRHRERKGSTRDVTHDGKSRGGIAAREIERDRYRHVSLTDSHAKHVIASKKSGRLEIRDEMRSEGKGQGGIGCSFHHFGASRVEWWRRRGVGLSLILSPQTSFDATSKGYNQFAEVSSS